MYHYLISSFSLARALEHYNQLRSIGVDSSWAMDEVMIARAAYRRAAIACRSVHPEFFQDWQTVDTRLERLITAWN